MQDLIIIMGVSGSGKTSVSQALAAKLSAPWLEGEDYHPKVNVDKLASGTPLNDSDRAPWIDAILRDVNIMTENRVILACSALTPYVQKRLLDGTERHIKWVLLDAPTQVISHRIKMRGGHFMPLSLLASQFMSLSPPRGAIVIDVDKSVGEVITNILARLNEKGR